MNKHVQGALLNAEIAIAHHGGCDISHYPRFHAPGVPTLRGAIELAQHAGIAITRKQVQTVTRNGYTETRIIVWTNASPIASAALSRNELFGEVIATGLAFRNAIERICFDQVKVWQDNERI